MTIVRKIITKADVGLGNVDNTSDANKPVPSAVTTALAGKSPVGHTHNKSEVGLANVDNTADSAKPVSTATAAALAGKAAAAHTHNAADIDSGTLAAARYSTTLTAAISAATGGMSAGDILYVGAGGLLSRLPAGPVGYVLVSQGGGVLQWAAPGASSVTGSAPDNKVLPQILPGDGAVGDTSTLTPGTWFSTDPVTYTPTWFRADTNEQVATTWSYTRTQADVGHFLRGQVVASNKWGSSAPAPSAWSGQVTGGTAPQNPPSLLTAPVLTGSTTQGSTVTATPGVYAG